MRYGVRPQKERCGGAALLQRQQKTRSHLRVDAQRALRVDAGHQDPCKVIGIAKEHNVRIVILIDGEQRVVKDDRTLAIGQQQTGEPLPHLSIKAG